MFDPPHSYKVKYIQKNIKGEEVPFRFKNKKAEDDYIFICEVIWGEVPCDVNWAIGTNIYVRQKKIPRIPFYLKKEKYKIPLKGHKQILMCL